LTPITYVESRRGFLNQTGVGLGMAALRSLLQQSNLRADNPLDIKVAHFAPKAKSVIYLHMIGAPSQLDLFDPKPELVKRDHEVCPDSLLAGRKFAFLSQIFSLKRRAPVYSLIVEQLSQLLPEAFTPSPPLPSPPLPSQPNPTQLSFD
jgi:hypothetical protein